jgi:hypothetical protein
MRQSVVSGIPSPNSGAGNERIERFKVPEISKQPKMRRTKLENDLALLFLFNYKNYNMLVFFI